MEVNMPIKVKISGVGTVTPPKEEVVGTVTPPKEEVKETEK